MNFETIVSWAPQTTRVNRGGRRANILKMTPPVGGIGRFSSNPLYLRSPNGLGRRKQLTRCRIKHELTVWTVKGKRPFHCGPVLQRISRLLSIKYVQCFVSGLEVLLGENLINCYHFYHEVLGMFFLYPFLKMFDSF